MSKQRIGLVLLGLVGLALLGSGVMKFINAEDFAAQLGGNAQAPFILGAIEIVALIALVIPRTRLLGVILAASYFGGAIAYSWLAGGEFPGAAMALSALVYIGALLYRPSLGDGSPTVE